MVSSSGNDAVFVVSFVLQPFLLRHKNRRLADLSYFKKNNIPQTIAVELSKRVFKMNTIEKIGAINASWTLTKRKDNGIKE
jgi:hypothetical protein